MYDIAANLKTPNFLGSFMAGKEAAQDARMKKMQMDAAEHAAAQAAKRKTYGQSYTQSLGGNLYSGANPYKPTGDDIINGKAFDGLKGAPAPMVPKKDFTTEGLYSAIFQDAAANGDMEYAAQYADKINANKKTLAEMSKAQLEAAKSGVELQGQLLGGVKDQGSWSMALAKAKASGIDTSGLPEQYDPSVVSALQQQALSAKEQLDQVWNEKRFGLDVAKFGYQRSNDAANRNVTIRGQNLTNARAAEANNIAAQDKANSRIEGAAGVDVALETLNTIANHPGLNDGTGSIVAPLLRNLPGTDAKGFSAQLEQFKSQVFLPAVQAMKGMGQLSNAEGLALTKAIGNLDPDMPTNEFKNQVLTIYKQMEAKRNRNYGDIPATNLGPSGAPDAPRLGTVQNGYIFLGGNPALPSNWKPTR